MPRAGGPDGSAHRVIAATREDLEQALREAKESATQFRKFINTIPTFAWCNLPDGPDGSLAVNLVEREKEMIETALRECKGVISGPCGCGRKAGDASTDARIKNQETGN